jgi:predicted nucleic acid-binding protein
MSRKSTDPRPFAWDTEALRHAIAVGRVSELLDLADQAAECAGRHVTTAAVVRELALLDLPLPARVDVADLEKPKEQAALARWLDRTGSTPAGRVNATVCAWADAHDGVAVVDDRGSHRVAEHAGLAAGGTLWVVARALASGADAEAASALVDRLMADGARYPHGPGGFVAWAKSSGHLG